MKKKIITLCLVIAMLSVAVIGGTLAYFTDVDQATNEFTVGNVSIDLYETVGQKDGAPTPNSKDTLIKVDGATGADLVDIGKDTDDAFTVEYAPAMPGDTLTKIVTVENDGTEPAYVALSIVQDNYGTGKMEDPDNWFNHRIDNYYEGKGWTATQMQGLYDIIFDGDGWNAPAYLHRDDTQIDGITSVSNMRYYPTKLDANRDQDGSESYVGNTSTVPILIAVDYSVSGHGKHDENMIKDADIYNECAAGTRIWVYYLYMPAKTSYTLDLSIKVPEVIDEYSIKAFEGMTLDVRSAAIQVSGFENALAAFTTLEEQFSFNYAEAHNPRPTEATEAPSEEETNP